MRHHRTHRSGCRRLVWAGLPAATLLLGGPAAVLAQQADQEATLEEVIVSAEKRDENLQNVPISIQAIGTQQLEDLHVTSFNDYVKLLPSVEFGGSGAGSGPGFARVFMRGVSSGDNGNHSGPLPSVGMYLDEQSITTIQGALDVHIYDIQRVEALAGPQGTLYGASSEAGTIRIITNKPDPSAFAAGYDVQVNTVAPHQKVGNIEEGFVNLPLGSAAAIRLVGWHEHDGGFIDNVPGTRTYPTSGITIDNASVAKRAYNPVDTLGGRAALKVDLDDSWTVTPTLMAQRQDADGLFAYDPKVGDLEVTHFYPEWTKESWAQAALTVAGKIGKFDLLYAGALLNRNDQQHQDYSDYSFFYDQCCSYGAYIHDNAGNLINPSQYIVAKDGYRKYSHELRLSSPVDQPLRFVVGAFLQRQEHSILQRYMIDGLGDDISITGWPDTQWLTKQERVDRDQALFGELSYDLTSKLTTTVGARFFHFRNSLVGFFGLPYNVSSTGERQCGADRSLWVPFEGAPCTDLPYTEATGSGTTPKLNFTYKFDDTHLVYATYSKGFRPGGVNRRTQFPPYQADYLKNYEVGWKSSWLGNRVRWNGAAFVEDWDDFQFSYLGANGLTNVTNAGGARILGLESNAELAATQQLTLSVAATLLDGKLTQDFCKSLTENPCGEANFAPSGTQLPWTPKFKADLTARYETQWGDYRTHAQANVAYNGASRSALLPSDEAVLGSQPAYTSVDLTFGLQRDRRSLELYLDNVLDERGVLYRYAECATSVCGTQSYIGPTTPRTIGLKFGQKF